MTYILVWTTRTSATTWLNYRNWWLNGGWLNGRNLRWNFLQSTKLLLLHIILRHFSRLYQAVELYSWRYSQEYWEIVQFLEEASLALEEEMATVRHYLQPLDTKNRTWKQHKHPISPHKQININTNFKLSLYLFWNSTTLICLFFFVKVGGPHAYLTWKITRIRLTIP